MSTVFETSAVIRLLGVMAKASAHTALLEVLVTQKNTRPLVEFSHIEPGAYPSLKSSEVVGLDVAVVLFLPPIPPWIAGRYPEIEVVRSILGELPVDPSCECPEAESNAAAS
jgi:hypothetical protein